MEREAPGLRDERGDDENHGLGDPVERSGHGVPVPVTDDVAARGDALHAARREEHEARERDDARVLAPRLRAPPGRARVERGRGDGPELGAEVARAVVRRRARAAEERARRVEAPGRERGDATSLQCERSARARSGKSIHASRALRGMIARPKIS